MNERQTASVLLQELHRLNPDVEAAVLLSSSGALLGSVSPDELADVLAPGVTLLSSVAARVAMELGRGSLDLIVVSGTHGWVVGKDLGDGRVLAVLARESGALGLLLDDVQACAERVRGAGVTEFEAVS